MVRGISDVRARLWGLAREAETLAEAAHALLGQAPEPEDWADLLDFVATEWLDPTGRTLAERLAGEPGLEDLAEWPLGVHTGLFTVDGHDDGLVLLRDVADDREVAVRVGAAAQAELPRRTVLKARLVPWRGGMEFFGDPGLYGVRGVMARMELLHQWREGPEPAQLARLRELRAGYARQRDQRRVFLEHFSADLVVFPNAEAMEDALDAFYRHLLHEDRGPRGDRPTRAETRRAATSAPAEDVGIRLGDTLRTGRPGLWFHDVEGALFLPSYGELQDHLAGRDDHPAVVELWLTNPELPRVALAHAGPTARLAAWLGVPDAPLHELLGPSPHAGVRTPSPLPEFDDQTG